MMVVEGNSKRITIEYKCPFCGQTKRADYNTDEFTDWYVLNMPVQDAFQRESATKREILISGICPECQSLIFNDEECA